MAHLLRDSLVALGLLASQADASVPSVVDNLVKQAAEAGRQRSLRVQELRGQHSIIATQPMLIDVMAMTFGLSDEARADVDEKVELLQARLDEAGNLIASLQDIAADDWQQRDAAVSGAMNRLEAARQDAWKALDAAPRIAPTS